MTTQDKASTGIYQTLADLGVASMATKEVFSTSTRDVEGLTVCRDTVSGVIYIDGYLHRR